MKNISTQIVYGLNILVFLSTIGIFLWTCYVLLTHGSLSWTSQGIAVWDTTTIITTVIFVVLPVPSFFLIRKLRKFKIEEKFTEVFVMGVLGIVGTLGILFGILLANISASMM